MSTGHHNILRYQARRIVCDVLTIMKREAQGGLDLRAAEKRTAMATGISEITVRKINTAAHELTSVELLVKTPFKKRSGRRRVTAIDSYQRGISKRRIHNFHETENDLHTINQLLKKLKGKSHFEGLAKILQRVLKYLEFRWKKTVNKCKVRIQFLRIIIEYRSEGRVNMYTVETYTDPTDGKAGKTNGEGTKTKGDRMKTKRNCKKAKDNAIKSMSDDIETESDDTKARDEDTETKGDNIPVKGDETRAKADDTMKDSKQNMSYKSYEKWSHTQMMPDIPVKSVIIIDNVRFKNKLEDPISSSNAQRTEIELWFLEKNIPYRQSMRWLDRLRVKYHKRVLKSNHHTVLQNSLYHSTKKPWNRIWGNDVMKHVDKKMATMEMKFWKCFSENIRSVEERYEKSDKIVDINQTEEQIPANDDDGDTEDYSFSDEDDKEYSGERLSDC